MRLFKKTTVENTSNDAVAQKIASRIIAGQRKLASYLNDKARGFSARQILYTLVIICILFGTYCTYLLVSSLFN